MGKYFIMRFYKLWSILLAFAIQQDFIIMPILVFVLFLRSVKQGCNSANVLAIVDREKDDIVITEASVGPELHSHEVSASFYNKYPHVRKLSAEQSKEASDLIG